MNPERTSEQGGRDLSIMYTLGRMEGKVDTLLLSQGDIIERVKHLEATQVDPAVLTSMGGRITTVETKLSRLILAAVAIAAASGSASTALLRFFIGV